MPDIELKERASALSFSSDEFDTSEYSSVASRAKLLDICLTNQSYSTRLVSFWGDENGDDDKHFFAGKPVGYYFENASGIFVGRYHWDAHIKRGRVKILKLSVDYTLVYGNLSDASPEYVELYFDKIGRFTSYPYFRSIFAVCVANSGLNLRPLPSLTDRVD